MPLTIADLNNAKADLDHIAALATSLAPTATDRLGHVKQTVSAVIAKMIADGNAATAAVAATAAAAIAAYPSLNDRGAWAASTAYNQRDIVSSGGVWYIAVDNHISGATFAGDQAAHWRVHQGLTEQILSQGTGAGKVGFKRTAVGSLTRTLGELWSAQEIDPREFGGIADGNSHPLSERYATLSAAQVDYPFATALTDQIDWCAVQAAVNSIPNGLPYTRTVKLSYGMWMFMNAGVNGTGKNLVIAGQGERSTLILVAANITALLFDATGVPVPDCGLMDIGVAESGAQPTMTAVAFQNCQDIFMRNVFVTTSGRMLRIGSTGSDVTFSRLSNVRGECQGGMEAIRYFGGGGVWNNVWVRKGRTAGVVGPTFWITGQTTALQVSNSVFGGKGTTRSQAITAISAGVGFFDVGAVAHPWAAGSVVVIRNTGTDYDRVWVVDSKPNNDTVRILNPDASLGNLAPPPAAARIENLHACVQMDNSLGPVNETSWQNVLLEGIENGSWVGSCALLIDATRGSGSMNTHQFNGITYDAGHHSVIVLGKHVGGGDCLVRDLRFTGGIQRYSTAAFWLRDGVKDVHITDPGGDCHRLDSTAGELVRSCFLFLDSLNLQPIQGVHVTGGNCGRQPDWTVAGIPNYTPDYGLKFGGQITDVHFTGVHFYGKVAPALCLNASGVIAPDARIYMAGVSSGSGLAGETTGTVIPTIASAAVITLPFFGDTFYVSGSTAITTINGGWVGRTITLMTPSPANLATGGNIGRSITTVAAQCVRLTFDGFQWRF